MFSIPTAAFSHPDPIWDPYVLMLHDNTYRMYMGTIPGSQYNYAGVISDTLEWNVSPLPAVLGSVPGVVELPDANGTLLLYFVDFWWEGLPDF